MRKNEPNDMFSFRYRDTIAWLAGQRLQRSERREILGMVWPRRRWFYAALLALGLVVGMGIRFTADWSFAFQMGKMVGEIER